MTGVGLETCLSVGITAAAYAEVRLRSERKRHDRLEAARAEDGPRDER